MNSIDIHILLEIFDLTQIILSKTYSLLDIFLIMSFDEITVSIKYLFTYWQSQMIIILRFPLMK
jgi:hypothetical protein